jgi:DNA-binding NarL/FixJ family response regulator
MKKDLKTGEEIQFTQREIDVLKHLVTGKNNTEIAKELCLSPHTVKAHLSSIFHKMGVGDRVKVAVKAVREKIVD